MPKNKTEYNIYSLTFKDGAVYIGRTVKPVLDYKLSEHYRNINDRLRQRIDAKMHYELDVILTTSDLEMANFIKYIWILMVDKENRLNRMTRQVACDRFKPLSETATCPACKVEKSRSEFAISRSRSTGRDCICRLCRRVYTASIRKAQRQGIYDKSIYRAAYQSINK